MNNVGPTQARLFYATWHPPLVISNKQEAQGCWDELEGQYTWHESIKFELECKSNSHRRGRGILELVRHLD